jgi:YggT family protein
VVVFSGARKRLAVINPVFWLILKILDIYSWVVIAAVIVSWLVAFGVINLYNTAVRSIVHVLDALTEPVFAAVRRILPPIAGLDLSPLVVLFAIWFLQYSLIWVAGRFFF